MDTLKVFRMLEMNSMIKKLEKASAAYYAGNPIMTDAEFDSAVINLHKTDPDNPLLKRIGAPVPGKHKVKHKIAMGSLNNANNELEFVSWLPDNNVYICLSHKLDGSSLELIYQDGSFVQAITRGDGEVGEDVTRNVLKSGNVPLSVDPSIVSVRCECLIHLEDWQEHFKGDANPRNSAAGTLRRHDGRNAEYLQFYAFDALINYNKADEDMLEWTKSEYDILYMLYEWFLVPRCITLKGVNDLVGWCLDVEKSRDSIIYEVDGVVAKVDDRFKSEKMGIRDGRPKGQIAIKFKPRGGETTLIDVVWQVGHTGSLTPVGKVAPVGVGGTTIQSVTLCNMDEIERLDIAIGDTVEIIRAGDTIPKLSKRIRKGKNRKVICPPKKCPECGGKTQKDGARLFCINPTCEGIAIGRVMTWIKKRDILNLGIGIVKGAGIDLIQHLYEMSLEDWSTVYVGNGILGEKRAKKIMDSLENSKSVSLPDFLGSIGITGIGRTLMADLCRSFSGLPDNQLTLKDIFWLKKEQIAKHGKFGAIRAADLCTWLLQHREEVESLESIMNLEYERNDSVGVFDGEKICFTGKSPKPRAEMTILAESAGATVSNSVSSDTTILVIADICSTSSKADKARKMGIQLMPPEDFLGIIK